MIAAGGLKTKENKWGEGVVSGPGGSVRKRPLPFLPLKEDMEHAGTIPPEPTFLRC